MDIRRNRLSDISIADALSSCPNLRSLFLTDNPICQAPSYRLVISSLVGTLQTLDGVKVDPQAQLQVTSAMVLEASAAMRAISEVMSDEKRALASASRGANSPTSPHTDFDTLSLKSHLSEGSAGGGGGGGGGGGIPDTGSLLTHGSSVVLAGNMAAAMRQRKRQSQRSAGENHIISVLRNGLSE